MQERAEAEATQALRLNPRQDKAHRATATVPQRRQAARVAAAATPGAGTAATVSKSDADKQGGSPPFPREGVSLRLLQWVRDHPRLQQAMRDRGATSNWDSEKLRTKAFI